MFPCFCFFLGVGVACCFFLVYRLFVFFLIFWFVFCLLWFCFFDFFWKPSILCVAGVITLIQKQNKNTEWLKRPNERAANTDTYKPSGNHQITGVDAQNMHSFDQYYLLCCPQAKDEGNDIQQQ